jgi:hypothetical protein
MKVSSQRTKILEICHCYKTIFLHQKQYKFNQDTLLSWDLALDEINIFSRFLEAVIWETILLRMILENSLIELVVIVYWELLTNKTLLVVVNLKYQTMHRTSVRSTIQLSSNHLSIPKSALQSQTHLKRTEYQSSENNLSQRCHLNVYSNNKKVKMLTQALLMTLDWLWKEYPCKRDEHLITTTRVWSFTIITISSNSSSRI